MRRSVKNNVSKYTWTIFICGFAILAYLAASAVWLLSKKVGVSLLTFITKTFGTTGPK